MTLTHPQFLMLAIALGQDVEQVCDWTPAEQARQFGLLLDDLFDLPPLPAADPSFPLLHAIRRAYEEGEPITLST